MAEFLLLVACLLLGTGVARFAHPPIGLAQAINWWVINIALPALVLYLVPQLQLNWDLWFLVVSQWLVFLGAWALFAWLGKRYQWSRARVGALILVCGLGNTSFMGYPMLEAFRGQEGLMLAVVADQMGCFIALALGGVLVAVLYSGGQPNGRDIARRVLLFPAFLSFVLALLMNVAGGWPELVNSILARLGDTLVPLALFSVGLRFKIRLGEGQLQPLVMGLGWKLLLAPLLILGLGVATGVTGLVLTVGVLQAAIAPMVSATILADQYHLDPPLANSILGMGIGLCFITMPIWNYLLG